MESEEEHVSPALDEVLQLLEVEPDDYELAWQELKALVLQVVIPDSLPLLDPSELELHEIRQIFGLRTINFYLWGANKPIPIPAYLQENLSRLQTLENPAPQTSNVALARIRVDQILLSAIFEEGLNIDPSPASHQSATHDPPSPRLELQDRTPLTSPVEYEGRTRLLTTTADASLWYDRKQQSTLGTSLLLVHASARNAIDSALGRLAACMGIVHLHRRSTGGAINGIVTDGNIFRFARIDAQGWWMLSREMDWIKSDQPRIYMYVRMLVREALGLMGVVQGSFGPRKVVSFGQRVSLGAGNVTAFIP